MDIIYSPGALDNPQDLRNTNKKIKSYFQEVHNADKD